MKTTIHIIEYITLDRRVIQLLNFGEETYSEVDLQKRKERKKMEMIVHSWNGCVIKSN